MFNKSRRTRFSYSEDLTCIWINSNSDDKSRSEFEKVFPTLKIIENVDQLVKYTSDNSDEKIFLILSESISREVIGMIDNLSQIHSMYVFGSINVNDEHLIKQSRKFQGSFNDTETICNQIKQDMIECENDTAEFTCVSPHFNSSSTSKDTNTQEPNFMYAQLIKEVLTTLEYSELDKKDIIDYLREKYANDNSTLKNIAQFELEYESRNSILWYTKASIFYKIINRGLRIQNIDILYSMRFFINNLHQQIVELHQNSNKPTEELKLYRGQNMSTKDFEQIQNNVGGLLSFTSFLSTSKDKEVALWFIEPSGRKAAVLMEITIDLASHSSTPYANITEFSNFEGKEEEEYLFSMGSVFRIKTIDVDDTGIYHVHLSLTSENDQQLTDLTKYMRKHYTSNPPSLCNLGAILYKKGDYIKAKEICEKILLIERRSIVQANIYNKLGLYNRSLGNLSQSLFYYEESLPKFEECGIKNGNPIGIVYTNIGRTFKEQKYFQSALDYYQKALYNHNLESNPDQDSIALVENNIGVLYFEQNNFSEALKYYVKSFQIRLEYLNPIHPDIAQSFNNIGMVYHQQGKHEDALFFYILSLEIKKRSMSPENPLFSRTLNNIAEIYIGQNKIENACHYLNEAIRIATKSLGSNHQDTQVYQNRLKHIMNK